MNNPQFSYLTILEKLPKRKVLAECVCGSIKKYDSRNVKKGSSKSCGCMKGKSISSSNEKRRLKDGEAAFNRLYDRYKRDAIRRKISFELNKNDFKDITNKTCYYCNSSPSGVSKPSNSKSSIYIYNGIDRVDNTLGYKLDNTVACCKICNIMKNKLQYNDFLNHIKLIYKHIYE